MSGKTNPSPGLIGTGLRSWLNKAGPGSGNTFSGTVWGREKQGGPRHNLWIGPERKTAIEARDDAFEKFMELGGNRAEKSTD